MRTLKHIGGILFASVSVVMLLSSIDFLVHPDPGVPLWLAILMLVGFGLIPMRGAWALLRHTMTAQAKPCPHCGDTDRVEAGVLLKRHNPWMAHFVDGLLRLCGVRAVSNNSAV